MSGSIDRQHRRSAGIPYWLGACVFLAVTAFFLWEEHRAHLLGAVPYLLLLLCPIVHLFMHRGHGGHGHHSSPGARDTGSIDGRTS